MESRGGKQGNEGADEHMKVHHCPRKRQPMVETKCNTYRGALPRPESCRAPTCCQSFITIAPILPQPSYSRRMFQPPLATSSAPHGTHRQIRDSHTVFNYPI